MKKFRETASRSQLCLLPRSVDEYVGEHDLVRYLDALIDEFDLSAIESCYSEFGRPAYSPRVVLKVLFYGKLRGIRSSRELARACEENLRFIYLAGQETPDFRTISEFRRKHQESLAGLLKQTIKIGLEQKVITLEHVAIDGTKIKAFASKKSFRKPEQLERMLEEVELQLEASFREDIRRDEAEDKRFGDSGYDEPLPEELRNKEVLREKIRAALRQYESTAGDKKRPSQVSTTDPESRFMKGEGIAPSYNCLTAVDESSGMAVAGHATNAVSDNAQLIPCLEGIEENTGENPAAATADKGFREHEGLAELKRRSVDGYISVPEESKKRFTREDFDYDNQTDTFTCPNGDILKLKSTNCSPFRRSKVYASDNCSHCPLKGQCLTKGKSRRTLHVSEHASLVDEMREKMSSPIGKLMARKRAAVVETAFGNIKGNKKLRQFLVRGIEAVNATWMFELAAHNLEKLALLALRTHSAA